MVSIYGAGNPPILHDHAGADGRFEFDAAPIGQWRVASELGGFEPVDVRVVVEPGETVDVGTLEMVVGTGPARLGAIEGRVRRLGVVEEDRHGGITVAAADTPFATVTTPEGWFHIDVTPGYHELRFRADGYQETGRREIGPVFGGETIGLEEDIGLTAHSGRVAGAVALPAGFGGAARFERVEVGLWSIESPDDVEPTERTGADREGRFEFDSVIPGDWRIEARADGFETDRAFVRIGPGQRVSIGTLRLGALEADDPTRLATLQGVAQRQGASETGHGGILVQAVDTPYTALTAPNGVYRVLVTPEPHRLRFHAAGYGIAEIQIEAAVADVDHSFWNSGLADQDFSRRDLTGVDLRGTEIRTINLDEAILRDAILSGLDLSGFDFGQQDLRGARLDEARLDGVVFNRSDLRGATIAARWTQELDTLGSAARVGRASPAVLDERFEPLDFRATDLTGARLAGAVLAGVNLAGRDLSAHDLRNVDFRYSTLRETTLPSTLDGVSFSRVDLRGSAWCGYQLVGASFRRAWLSGADLRHADLSDADLRDAWLIDADLRGAVVTGVQFEGAHLDGAQIRETQRDAVGFGWTGQPTWIDDCGQTASCAP